MTVDRSHWLDDVEDVIRSRHYTWIPEGLGGEPVDVAMMCLLTDIMHICRRTGIDFDDVLQKGRQRFEAEELQQKLKAASANEADST